MCLTSSKLIFHTVLGTSLHAVKTYWCLAFLLRWWNIEQASVFQGNFNSPFWHSGRCLITECFKVYGHYFNRQLLIVTSCEPICLINKAHSFDYPPSPHTHTHTGQAVGSDIHICKIKEGIVQKWMFRNRMFQKIICMVLMGFLPIYGQWIMNNFVLLPLTTLIKCKFYNFFSKINNIIVLNSISLNFFKCTVLKSNISLECRH